MFANVPNPIPARMKGLNRAEICDVNFQEFVKGWSGAAQAKPAGNDAILDGSALDAQGFHELFESQLISRHLDLMARVRRVVADIDEIVRLVRFPGWQGTQAGEREVKKALRKALFKYKLHADEELFEKAYSYIRQYY